MTNVFVYGTLKYGFPNDDYLNGFLFDIGWIEGFEMYGKSNSFPFVSRGIGSVHGEVYYNIPKYLLDELDALEGHPTFYKREKVLVNVGTGTVEAQIYLNDDHKDPNDRIIEGVWT